MPTPGAEPTFGAIILAGGLNTRMKGRNKAFLRIGGRSILDRLLATLRECFAHIVLVTREPELYGNYPLRVVRDIYPARSSLTGIHAGLTHSQTDYALVVPCDLPLLQPALIRLLLAEVEPAVDAVVPLIDGHYEPLCAIYSKRCIAPIAARLDQGFYKISRFFDEINLKCVPAEKIRRVDRRMLSFLNVNTPAAFKAVQDIASER